jgi:WD40 repeat protein
MLDLAGKTGKVCSLAFAPDGTLLASGSWNWVRADHEDVGEVRLRDLATGTQRALGRKPKSAHAVAFSPNGEILASGGHDRTVAVWDVADGTQCGSLREATRLVTSLAFSPDGSLLAAGCGNWAPRVPDRPSLPGGELILWAVPGVLRGGFRHVESRPFPPWVLSLAFSPQGVLALGLGDGQISLLDTTQAAPDAVLRQGLLVRALAWSPDGKTLAAASDYEVRLWDVETGQVRARLTGHFGLVWSLAFSPDGRTLLTGSWDMTVRLWDTHTGRERMKLDWGIGKVSAVVFSPDGKRAAAGGDDQAVVVWDLE